MPDLRKDGDKKWWRTRTKLEKILIVCAAILGVLALIFLLVIAFRKSCSTDPEVCSTKHCVEAAAELLEFIDIKQDPCKNFYRYTCGAYFKNAVKKDSPSPWSSTQTLFENEMKSLVVDPIKKKDTHAHIMLKKFYHECMNETKIEEDDNQTFLDAINELGGWPLINETWVAAKFDWVDWYIGAKQKGLPVIGFFHFARANTEGNDTVLRVTGPHLTSYNNYNMVEFVRLMRRIINSFEATEHKQDHRDLNHFIQDLYNHRDELDDGDDDDDEEEEEKTDGGDDGDDDDEDDILNIQDLTNVCPDVPWLKILNGISGNSSQFDNSSDVKFDEKFMKKYCESLQATLKKTHPKVVANYFVWSIIENAHYYMDKGVRRAYQDTNDDSADRFTICYEKANEKFEFVKEAVYIRKKTNPQVKSQILELIDIMKELFAAHLKKCKWMDETTRDLAVEKALAIESLIGADDEVYDIEEFDKILGLDGFNFTSDNIFEMMQERTLKETHHLFETMYGPEPDDWKSFFEKVVAVNAFFLPSSNAMIIPAPILTSIFFNKKFPAFMNYGAMGSTVGHEFMHGFGNSSREVDLENDTTISDWWTKETAAGFDKAVQCVIDEYESIPFRYRLNGSLTLEENVADYVGADLGYEAYQKYIKKHGEEKRLPGIPLTPNQIYWVQTATNFCFRKLDDNEVDYEEEDEHGIPAFRVQGPARNSKYFAEAFNCPVGSNMNPKDKCRIL